MDSWNTTDTEHPADTEPGEGGSPGLPPEDAGYDVTDEVHLVLVEAAEVDDEVEADVYDVTGFIGVVDVVDQVDVVDVAAEADLVDGEVETPAHEDQGGEQPTVGTAPAASAPPIGPAGTTTPEASIDEVEAVLDQVDEALARLDDGTYGRCVHCGQTIEDDRLAQDPTGQRCGECVELVLSGVD